MTETTVFECDADGCERKTEDIHGQQWAWVSFFDPDGDETESSHVCDACMRKLGLSAP